MWNPESGIRNLDSGIRKVESGICSCGIMNLESETWTLEHVIQKPVFGMWNSEFVEWNPEFGMCNTQY